MSTDTNEFWSGTMCRRVCETVRQPLLCIDGRRIVRWANPSFLEAFRLPSSEVAGLPLDELPGGQWSDEAFLRQLDTLDTSHRELTDLEMRHHLPHAGTRQFLVNVALFEESAEASKKRIVLSLEDVTERRNISAQQARLAALVESSSDAIVAMTFDGRIIDWNAGAQRVYGFSADEIVGKSIENIIPEEQREDFERQRQQLQQGKTIRNHETFRLGKSGNRFPISLTMSPIRNAAGEIVLLSSIERDISRRVERERHLREAIQAAEQATRTQTEFVANVSHELRTPMSAIIGMSDLALDENLSPLVRDYLKTIRTSADVLIELVNDILDFSKLKSGTFELEVAPFDLHELLNSLLKGVGLRAYEKGLEIICHIDESVPGRLHGDALRIRQVLTNLLSNSIKFTEVGEIEIDVTCRQPSEDLAVIRFAVRDTGIGISEEDQQRIFGAFTQADSSTTRTYQGTGLGLTICDQLVRTMGGRMQVQSQLGQGSEFSFEIKLRPLTGNSALPSTDQLKQLAGLRVLVVDDNATNRNFLTRVLSSWSLQPEAVASGPEAIKVLRDAVRDGRKYEMVVVDALMPEMDGFDVAAEIERDSDLSTTTVLMLSSADRQVFRDRLDQIQLAAFLEKPVTQSTLWDTIVETIEGLPVRKQPAPGSVLSATPVQTLRILLAEDTPANQKVVRRVIEKRGHSLQVAHNGREALDLLNSAPAEFDLVLMDVQMPILDGYQATAAIRNSEDERIRRIPVIAMTAHAMKSDRDHCFAAGMDGYLSKPIDVRKLLTVIEGQVATKARQSRSAYSPTTKEANVNTLDIEAALSRLGGDQELVNDMLEFFAEDVPPLLREIDIALQSEDAHGLERAAHSLKGLVANFDRTGHIRELADRLQTCGQQSDFSGAVLLVPELRTQAERMVADAQAALNR